MDKRVKLKNFFRRDSSATQNMKEAVQWLEKGLHVFANVITETGTLKAYRIYKLDDVERFFITKSGNKYIIETIENEIRRIEVVGFFNRMREECCMFFDLDTLKKWLDAHEHTEAHFYEKATGFQATSRILEFDFEKRIFSVQSGNVYQFEI